MTHPKEEMAQLSQFSPADIASALNQTYPPTTEQAEVIASPMEPLLVVAGAGAGKTETMAARVVWMVANGLVRTNEVLGLTFTRKAAAELEQRIRRRLDQLARSSLISSLPPSDPRRESLRHIQPTVMTYDAFVGQIINEFGLLLPIEPDARLATPAEQWILANRILRSWDKPLETDRAPVSVLEDLLNLTDEMNNHLASPAEVRQETQAFIENASSAPRSDGKEGMTGDVSRLVDRQNLRLNLLDVQEEFRHQLSEKLILTFGEQMSAAAQLASQHPEIGQEIRSRYKAVFLDEYQDTGHAQRVFLRALFAENGLDHAAVTAVGDPMQCIYGWRGATAANLQRFLDDYAYTDSVGKRRPARKLELTKSFRNPAEILDLANAVSERVLTGPLPNEINQENYSKRPRFVSALSSGIPTQGQITLSWHNQEDEEVAWVADQLAAEYEEKANDPEHPFTGAVLVRKNRQVAPIAQALLERGVPVEIPADALDQIPEVKDVLAVMRVLVDPTDDIAMLHVLTGPRWRFGAKDLLEIGKRAAQLVPSRNGQEAREDASENTSGDTDDPYVRFVRAVDSLDIQADGNAASIVDAIADPDSENEEILEYSAAARSRIRELTAELRQLRTRSLSMPLPDLLADIEDTMGIRTEVLSRANPSNDGVAGTVHLDRLMEEAESFSANGGTAKEFLEYLDAAQGSSRALPAGDITVQQDRVQVLTVHRAKGLEWDVVAVPFCDNSSFEDEESSAQGRASAAWTQNAACIPSSLRGDAITDENPEGVPDFSCDDLEKQADYKKANDDFVERIRAFQRIESDRLFYVAITRSAGKLLLSGNFGSVFESRGKIRAAELRKEKERLKKLPKDPVTKLYAGEFKRKSDIDSRYKTLIAEAKEDTGFVLTAKKQKSAAYQQLEDIVAATIGIGVAAELSACQSEDESAVIRATEDGKTDVPLQITSDYRWGLEISAPLSKEVESKEDIPDATEQVLWPKDPAGNRRADLDAGAALVREAMDRLARGEDGPTVDAGTLAQLWDQETTALIEESRNAERTDIAVELGAELSTSEVMNVAADPAAFARRHLRPLPYKPNLYAKRGTAFHNWIEERSGGSMALLDDDDLAVFLETDDEAAALLREPELDALKKAFLASEWAERVPEMVEQPFTLQIGEFFIRGRMDAVFHEGQDPAAGWTIIDWKTGRKPRGRDMDRAAIQLAVYREALIRILEQRGISCPSVRAAFHYVRDNETYEPSKLLTSAELAKGALAELVKLGEDESLNVKRE